MPMEAVKEKPAVLGIGTPLLDQMIHVSNAFLMRLSGRRGGSEPVDYRSLCNLIASTKKSPICTAGGSTANTVKGLSQLSIPCALAGKIGKDEAGNVLFRELSTLGVTCYLKQSSDLPTGQVLCLISPDLERTMRYFLGAGSQGVPDDLSSEMFEGVELVHIEGYQLANKGVVEHAMKLAKQAGARISFDTASVEIISAYKKQMLDLISKYVDILFANEEEAHALTGEDPQKSVTILQKLTPIAIVKMGEHGCWVADKQEKLHYNALKVDAIDTTGAGDLFATGFLYGLLEKKSLVECARYGTTVAAHVVQIIGANIPSTTWESIRTQLKITRHVAGHPFT